ETLFDSLALIPEQSTAMQRPPARRLCPGSFLVMGLLIVVGVAPVAFANGTVGDSASAASAPRIATADPLNGGFLLVNNHGMLFHPELSDIQEDVAYARWLGSGIVRVFATDNNGLHQWDGTRVGTRIAEVAP